MKQFLFTSLLIPLNILSFGQKVHFTDSANKWLVYSVASQLLPPIIDSGTYSYNGSILYNGNFYQKLYYANSFCIGYTREDTLSKKVYGVYLLSIDSVYDSTEYTLYDYNLHVGDTFNRSHTVPHYVTQVDSVKINNIWHKTWYFAPTNTDTSTGHGIQSNYIVIEGIGSTSGPFFPADPTTFEADPILTCFNTNDSTPMLSKKIGAYFDNASSCNLTFGLSVYHPIVNYNLCDLYPNPADESTIITFTYPITGHIIISNEIGQRIFDASLVDKSEIQLKNKIKAPGIYYYRIIDNNTAQQFFGKFISQ